jgi:hypothetical protein
MGRMMKSTPSALCDLLLSPPEKVFRHAAAEINA